jgi:hypothetical protein
VVELAARTWRRAEMNMRSTGLRMPEAVMSRLRTLAHEESLRTGTEITWSDLVRNAVDKFLAGRNGDQSASEPCHTLASPALLGETAEMESISFRG